eukprot:Awhi_evm1s15121
MELLNTLVSPGDEECLTRPGFEEFDGYCSPQDTEDACKVYTVFCNWGIDPEALPTPVEETCCKTRLAIDRAQTTTVILAGVGQGTHTPPQSTPAVSSFVHRQPAIDSCFILILNVVIANIQNQGETNVDCGGVGAVCEVPATSDDGVRNQDEESTDYGGVCDACPPLATCSDDEEGTDCGGVCSPCFSCFGGVQNGNEEDIDCGGPCAPCPTTPELLETCSDGVQNCGVCAPWFSCMDVVDLALYEETEEYPRCDDGIMNGEEEGTDCCGICAPRFSCSDGEQNGDEVGLNVDLKKQAQKGSICCM